MPINGEIKADKIRLISESGEQLGILSLSEALAKAEEANLDLVQMAKEGEPLVCRLLNHGKHIFDAKKQKAASKKKQKRQLRGTTEIAKGDQVLVDKMLKIKT